MQEWGKDFSDNENSKEVWHLCFSIKESPTQKNLEKLQASVSEVMQEIFFGYKYAMILHTHQNNPHIHIIVNKRNFLTNKKIHFKNKSDIKEFFSDIRDNFAYSLRARELKNLNLLEKQQTNFKNMQTKVLYATTQNVFIQKDSAFRNKK